MMNEVRGELFLRRLPPEIRDGLSPEQQAAIRVAAGQGREPERHRINLEFGLPTPWGRYYVAIFAGPERRNSGRRGSAPRRRDTHWRPLMTTGNSSTHIIRTTCLGLLLLAVLLLYETVVQP